MSMFKKFLIITLSLSLLVLFPKKISALCQPRSLAVTSCSGSMPYSCTYQQQNYCCDDSTKLISGSTSYECNQQAQGNECSNGAANGAITCDPTRPNEAFICRAGQNPELGPLQNCLPGYTCVEGVGCTAPAPSACSDGTPNLGTVCRGTPANVFVCRAGQNPEFELFITCRSDQSCVDGKCITQQAPTSPPQEQDPSSPLVPDDSFLILTNPLTVDGGQCSSLLSCTIRDPFGMLRVVNFSRPAGILNALIPYLFTFAGLILFVMLLWGGFEMLSGAATPKSQEAGKQRITAALTGFALLFMSYWFAQIIEYIFGLNIL